MAESTRAPALQQRAGWQIVWPTCKRCNDPHDDEMLEYCADCRTLEPGY